MKRSVRYSAWVSLIAVLIIVTGAFSCDAAKSSAVAVNRYAESLSHLQDAEITAHGQGTVDDAQHAQIQKAIKLASKAGRDLDTAIAIGAQGGDPSQYVGAAEVAFNDVLNAVQPTNQKALVALAEAAGALLKNAISLIRSVHAAKPHSGSSSLAFWMSFGLLGMAAVSVDGVIKLLLLITQLEPVAFDLILKLAATLKGKTTEEVLAMNEQLFGKVDATADAELAKLDAPKG